MRRNVGTQLEKLQAVHFSPLLIFLRLSASSACVLVWIFEFGIFLIVRHLLCSLTPWQPPSKYIPLAQSMNDFLFPIEIWDEIFNRSAVCTKFALRYVTRSMFQTFGRRYLRKNPMISAAKSNALSLLQWDQTGPARSRLSWKAFRSAVRYADVPCLTFIIALYPNGRDDYQCVIPALRNPHPGVFSFCLSQGVLCSPGRLFVEVLCSGDSKLVKRSLEEINVRLTVSMATTASDHEGLVSIFDDILQRLLSSPSFSYANNLTFFAHIGHLDKLKRGIKEGGNLHTENLYKEAAARGHLHIMEYLLSMGVSLESKGNLILSGRAAILGGRVEVLKWLVAHGLVVNDRRLYEEWSANIVRQTSEDTALELYKYAHAQGVNLVQFDYLWLNCGYNNYSKILNWGLSVGYAIHPLYLLNAAVLSGDLNRLKELNASGVEWGSISGCMCRAAKVRDLEIIKFLSSCGCPVNKSFDPGYYSIALKDDDVAYLKFLQEASREPLPSSLYTMALSHNALNILNYLKAQKIEMDSKEMWTTIGYGFEEPHRVALEWVWSNGFVLTQEMYNDFYQNHNKGDNPVLKWLTKKGWTFVKLPEPEKEPDLIQFQNLRRHRAHIPRDLDY